MEEAIWTTALMANGGTTRMQNSHALWPESPKKIIHPKTSSSMNRASFLWIQLRPSPQLSHCVGTLARERVRHSLPKCDCLSSPKRNGRFSPIFESYAKKISLYRTIDFCRVTTYFICLFLIALTVRNVFCHTFLYCCLTQSLLIGECLGNGSRRTWGRPAANKWRALAKERIVLGVPMWLYCDDTSGNISKKWNKLNSWLATLAGLPSHLVQLPFNVHFLCTSSFAPPLEMMAEIVKVFRCVIYQCVKSIRLLSKRSDLTGMVGIREW